MNLQDFDPDGVGLKNANIFGLPTTEESASLIIIPMPWEVTVSYRPGTANGPQQVFNESFQVDLYDADAKNAWQKGYYMLEISEEWKQRSTELREKAVEIIEFLEEGGIVAEDEVMLQSQNEINTAAQEMNDWVYQQAHKYIQKGKKVALIGGDHSTPLGIIKAVAEENEEIGLLQIDAHADLRIAYEGFTYSHASIMYNVLQEVPQVTKLIQVGIRDYSDGELDIIQQSDKIKTFFDSDIKRRQFKGENWHQICEDIIAQLPQKIYISFDIDGLDPKLCPNTGTPVPGGFEMEEIFYLFKLIKDSGKNIVGFDVNEVAVGEEKQTINAIVGARVLYKLCNLTVS